MTLDNLRQQEAALQAEIAALRGRVAALLPERNRLRLAIADAVEQQRRDEWEAARSAEPRYAPPASLDELAAAKLLAWLEVEARADIVRAALASLREREGKVLELRFGLAGEKPLTLQATGTALGLTRERMRQYESQALRKLRHPSRLG